MHDFDTELASRLVQAIGRTIVAECGGSTTVPVGLPFPEVADALMTVFTGAAGQLPLFDSPHEVEALALATATRIRRYVPDVRSRATGKPLQ